MIDLEESVKKVEAKVKASNQLVDELLKTTESFLDEDGYPTDDFLRIVLNWTWNRPRKELFNLINLAWWHGLEWNESEEPHDWDKDKMVYRYHISTGGWSGNESIIQAMKQNEYFLWSGVWVQSRRGGHYIFELDKEEDV